MNGQALRIFAHVDTRSTLHRPGRPLVRLEEAPSTETPAQLEVVSAESNVETAEPIDATIEARIIDVLTTAPQFGETISTAYQRKERELVEAFMSLSRVDASALHKRLSDPRADDALAQKFARLVVDRRTRLLAVLADAPRREARRR